MKTLTILTFLTLTHLTTSLPTTPKPQQCHCYILDTYKPLLRTKTPTTTSISDQCAPLGHQLENWRTTNPSIYQTFLGTVVEAKPNEPRSGTPTETDLKPLATSVLLEMARSGRQDGGGDATDTALPSAPTSLVRERIICRTVVVEDQELEAEYHDSVTTLFVLGVIVVMAVLACVAELLTILMNWCLDSPGRRASWSSNRVRLSGEEKKLYAYSSGECSSPLSRRVHFNVCHAYAVEGRDDEDTTAVL